MTATTRSLTLWLPALCPGAPSEAAGMARASAVYRTAAQALAHEHWADQAPWATARRVVVRDGHDDWMLTLGERIGTSADLAYGVCDDTHEPRTAAVTDHLNARRWASAIAAHLGWDDGCEDEEDGGAP